MRTSVNSKSILQKKNTPSSKITCFLQKNIFITKAVSIIFISLFLTLVLSSCSANTFKTAVEGITGGGSSTPTPAPTPEIVFDGPQIGPVQSDTVTISVNHFANATHYQYVYILHSSECDATTNFSTPETFTSGVTLATTFDDETRNNQRICARVENSAGDILYQKSNRFNIDVQKPTIIIHNNVSAGPTKIETVKVEVTDPNLDASSLQYGFSADNACDASDSYSETYLNNEDFTINTEAHNGKYLCFMAKDTAGNISYLPSANKLNIDVTPPTIVFVDDVDSGPVGSDTVKIRIEEVNQHANLTTVYKYALIAEGVACDASASFGNDYNNDLTTVHSTNGVKLLPPTGSNFDDETASYNDKYICAKAEDSLGNTSFQKSAHKFNIRNVPTITISGVSSSWVQSETVTITVSGANLNSSSYAYVLKNTSSCAASDFTGGETSFTSGTALAAFNNEINHNGKYICAKASNNTGTAFSVSSVLKIDTTAPSALAFDKDVFATAVKQNPIQIRFTEAHMGTTGTAQYGFVANSSACTTSFTATTNFTNGDVFTITSNANNGKYLCAVVTDEAGNKAAVVSAHTLNINASVPIAVLSNTPSDPSKDTVLDVTVSGSGVVEYQYKVADGSSCSTGGYGSFTAVATKITHNFSANPEGDMVLCVIAKDAAGNVQSSPTLYTWKKDTQAPTATIANAPTGTNNTTTLDVTIAGTTPTNADVTHYKYKVGEKGSTNCGNSTGYSASEITVATKITNDISSSPSLADGEIHLCVVGRDQAGNWQTYANASFVDWTKDTTPPPHPVTLSGTPANPSYDTTLDVTVSGTDVTHYRFKVGSKASTNCSVATGYSSETVADVSHAIGSAIGTTGDKRLCVVARDAAGNWQPYANATIYEWTRVDTLTVTINQSVANPEQKDPINTLPIYFDVVFNLPIDTSTFTTSDITQDTTASGASSAVTWELTTDSGNANLASGNGKHFKLKAVTGTSTGKIIPSLAPNQVNYANNSSLKNSASTSTDNVVEYTLVKPNVTINQASGQNDPTNTLPIVFDVVFDREINTATFTTDDITQKGNASASGITWKITTAGGSTDLTTGDKKTFKLKATAATAAVATGNTIQPSIIANVVQSVAGNGNNASSATDNTVVLDTTAPTLTLSNTPSGTVNPINLDVVVNSSDGAVQYQYTLQNGSSCGSYGSWVNISQKIQDSLSTLSNGTVLLCVKGKDAAGNEGTAVTATWTKDTSIAQAIATAGLPTATNNTTILDITVGGTGVTQYMYKILDSNSSDFCYNSGGYSSAIAVGTHITNNITGKAEGTIRLCLLGYNGTNWQPASSGSVYTWVKDTTPPTIVSAETMDKNHDGKIDGYKIVFSEAVDDSTFTAANWSVNAYTNITRNTSFAGDIADDETIYLSFDQNNLGACNIGDQLGCDTGKKPDLTMTAGGLKDIYGNNIAAVQSATVAEADRAVPVLVGAKAASQLRVRAVFSENVLQSTTECGTGSSQPTTNCSTLYNINNGLGVSKAVLENGSTSGNTVMLTTSQQTKDANYTLTATAGKVKDVNNNTVISGSNTATFFGAAPALVLVSAEAVNNTTVKIVFNEPLNTTHSETTRPANYSVGGLSVNTVTVDSTDTTNKTLLLTTTSQTSDTPNGYTVTIVGGQVLAQNGTSGTCDAPNNTATFTGDKLPEVVSVASINATTVFVTFSEDVIFNGTATNSGLRNENYVANNGLSISGNPVSHLPNKVVKLTTTAQTIDRAYRLTVNNVQDLKGNVINPNLNYGNFIGVEKLKLISARNAWSLSETFGVFRLSFSKPFTYDGSGNGNHSADNLVNWSFPFPAGTTVAVCTATDDSVCPSSYVQGTDTDIYFKVTPKPPTGAYTIVGATATNSPTGAAGCLLPAGTSDTTNCLKPNPDDRVAISWRLPVNIEEGAVYNDPFNDNITFSGQVLQYNGKLLIGPNAKDSGLFMTDINLQNSMNIVLDSDNQTAGIQTFQDNLSGTRVYEHGTTPLAGIDYMYAACYKSDGSVSPTLSGVACSSAGGEEYLFIVGFIEQGGTTTGVGHGYQSVWITKDKISPFVFKHVKNISNSGTLTYRAMSVYLFKGYVYQAQQHIIGGRAPRSSRYAINSSGNWEVSTYSGNSTGAGPTNLEWFQLNRLGAYGSPNKNGQRSSSNFEVDGRKQGLISIDYMYEYDNGTGANVSQLYMANGGSCSAANLTNRARTSSAVDGGILRSTVDFSGVGGPGRANSSNRPNNSSAAWEDVTPGGNLASGAPASNGSAAYIWNSFMSKALPQDPRKNGDWKYLIPENTIAPSIKAIPKMVEFNGDLYVIRNACADVTVTRLSTTIRDTCEAGKERPQLWRLPKNCGTANACAQAWQFIGNTTSTVAAIKYTTRMGGATWVDGTDQATKTAKNKYITLLEKVGDRLYVGFDNEDGINIWRTKSGVTAPTTEADFEAVCQTGNECFQASRQFGLHGNASELDIKIFDSIAVNDAGKDYLILNARSGDKPLRIYRQGNN